MTKLKRDEIKPEENRRKTDSNKLKHNDIRPSFSLRPNNKLVKSNRSRIPFRSR